MHQYKLAYEALVSSQRGWYKLSVRGGDGTRRNQTQTAVFLVHRVRERRQNSIPGYRVNAFDLGCTCAGAPCPPPRLALRHCTCAPGPRCEISWNATRHSMQCSGHFTEYRLRFMEWRLCFMEGRVGSRTGEW
eukprot:2702515-Rhodomonas_salina.1